MTRFTPALECLRIVLFAGALAAPAIDMLVRDVDARGPGPELRLPAPMPEVPRTLPEFVAWPRAFEQRWNDTFGLRDRLLRWHSILKLEVFGESPSARHLVGKDGWIFYLGDRSLEIHRGLLPFAPDELEGWKRKLEGRRDWLAHLGIAYAFAICPDKQTIYPERVPERLNAVGPSRLDQLATYLKQRAPDVDFIDLRPELFADKRFDTADDFVYYPYGSHWTPRGGLAALRALADDLRPKLQGWPRVPTAAESAVSIGADNGDSEARNMYVSDLFPQVDRWYVPAKVDFVTLKERGDHTDFAAFDRNHPERPRVVVFHDSFGPFLDTCLGQCCSRVYMRWETDFEIPLILREKPDVVIDLYVERALLTHSPFEDPLPPVDPVTASYLRSRGVVFQFDPESAPIELLQALSPIAKHTLDARGPVLDLDLPAAVPPFALPGVTVPDAEHLVAEVDVEGSPQASIGFVFAEAEGRVGTAIDVPLRANGGAVYAPIAVPKGATRLSLRLPAGHLRLRSIGLRIARPR